MSEDWLSKFEPSSAALLDLLLPQVDDRMLQIIAASDYGQDSEKHLPPLIAFRNLQTPTPLNWYPEEVLELTRWSQPEHSDQKQAENRRVDHLIRAFACSALFHSYWASANFSRNETINDTAIQLATSLRILDGDFLESGARFMAWVLAERDNQDPPNYSDNAFLGAALLSLAIHSDGRRVEGRTIELCQWIDAQILATMTQQDWNRKGRSGWAMITRQNSMLTAQWNKLGDDLLTFSRAQPESEMATWVELIGSVFSES